MKKQLFAGKFEIQGEISKGQTGTIYYGYDVGLRQEVAIKVYHSHINGRLIRGKTFIEKSKPLLLIDHPNLIKIFKVEEEDDTPVVFMEFFDAPSLQQIIHDKGPMPVQDMLMLAREITEVLVHTHFQGIIHGTLHPGHVLVGPQGQIKVMDLGLSWILMDILSDCDVELLRPLPYLLPEIAKGELLNVSSDLYCLGFMMYEMLTGTVPYAGLPKTSIMGKLAFDQSDPAFDFPDSVPEAVCDLIRHMTHNTSQQRLQDSTHVLTIINQQLTKLPLSKESLFLPPVPDQQIEAPTPKAQQEPKETSSTESAPSITPTPKPKVTHPYQRPQTSAHYTKGTSSKKLSKIGIAFALILLAGISGTMGFWYHDFLEPDISIFPNQYDTSRQGTSLPPTMSVESEISNAHGKNSLNIQDPLLGTDQLSQTETPSVAPRKETENGPLSTPTLLPTESELQPDQTKITQTPKAEKTKPGESVAPTQKLPELNPPQSPATQQSPKVAPVAPETVPSPSTKALKKTPAQQPASQPPVASKGTPAPTAVPTQQPPASNQFVAPMEKHPSKGTPSVSRMTPLPITKPTMKTPAQKSISQQPAANRTKSTATLVPTQKQPESKQSTTSEKQSSGITPIASESTSVSKTKTPKGQPLQVSPLKSQEKEAINQKKKSASLTPSSGDSAQKPTDKEMEELLQSLDTPTTDLSLITEP